MSSDHRPFAIGHCCGGLCLITAATITLFVFEPVRVSGQDDSGPDSQTAVTVRGQFTNSDQRFADFDWTALAAELTEVIQANQPPFPDGWDDMNGQQRRQWLQEFQASDEGRALIAANKALIADRLRIEAPVEKDGSFAVYDVPPGQYTLQAHAHLEHDGKSWSMQTHAQIEVGEVDELELAALPVEIVRMIRPGESAPEIEGTAVDGVPVRLSEMRGNHVLVVFALAGNPAFGSLARDIQETAEQVDGLQVLTIAVDDNPDEVREFVDNQQYPGPVVIGSGWSTPAMQDYGIRAVPSLWLVDPDGRVRLTSQTFLFELGREGSGLASLVSDAIQGKFDESADQD